MWTEYQGQVKNDNNININIINNNNKMCGALYAFLLNQ